MTTHTDLLLQRRPGTKSIGWLILASAGLGALAYFALVTMATMSQVEGSHAPYWVFVGVSAAVFTACIAKIRTHTRQVAIASLLYLPVTFVVVITALIVYGLATFTWAPSC